MKWKQKSTKAKPKKLELQNCFTNDVEI